MLIQTKGPLKGIINVPGDKSISHRAIMFGSLAEGITEVTNFLEGADCLSTIKCFQQMGIDIDHHLSEGTVTVHGKGLYGLKEPVKTLDVGNSGTTMRLLSGILCGQSFPSVITGDASIQQRPMNRIMTPLKLMGANIHSENDNGCAPLIINCHETNIPKTAIDSVTKNDNSNTIDWQANSLVINKRKGMHHRNTLLEGIHYISPVASAQVKSCILLAGLYADGETSVTEPSLSRNHSELMLTGFGATVITEGNKATVLPAPYLVGQKIMVPGDISSAAYFIAAGLIVPGSEIVLKNVGINPTRDGILRVCLQMGAKITIENKRYSSGEPVADLIIRHSELAGTTVGGSIIPTLIDEIPIIAILACFAKGETVIKDASELKVKESNRIDVMVDNLTRMGADITATEDGMIIRGGKPLHGALVDSKSDHRIAMSFAIAGLMAEGETTITNPECVDISYPGFYADLANLQRP